MIRRISLPLQATADSRQRIQPATVPHVGHAALPLALLCRVYWFLRWVGGEATIEPKVAGRAPDSQPSLMLDGEV